MKEKLFEAGMKKDRYKQIYSDIGPEDQTLLP